MIDFSHVVNKLVSEFGDETIALEYMDTNEAGRLLNIMEDQLGVLNNSEINGDNSIYIYAAWGSTPYKYGLAF